MFYESTIQLSVSSGEYTVAPINGDGWVDEGDLLCEIRGNVGEVFLLGTDELPAGLEDIRGRIHNEPAKVYGYLDTFGNRQYFGIEQR